MGVFSTVASSSSEVASLALAVAICVAFFGLNGESFSALSSDTVFARPRVDLTGAAAGLRIGLARSPVALSETFAFMPLEVIGIMFSLSGSSNFTDFFGTADFVTVTALPLVGRLAGSGAGAGSSSATSTFFARPRVTLTGSGAGASTIFFGLPRVGFGAGASSTISGSGCVVFLGLPLVVFGSGSIIGSGWVCNSSSWRSSARVFRFVVEALRVSLAFDAAVTMAVLVVVSVLAAARARVTLFGGDWSFMLKVDDYKCANDARKMIYIDAIGFCRFVVFVDEVVVFGCIPRVS